MSDPRQVNPNPGGREPREAKVPQEAQPRWRLAKGEPEIHGVFFAEQFFPLARQDNLGLGFQEGLLGAAYGDRAFEGVTWQEGLPEHVRRFFQERQVRARFTVVTRDLIQDDAGRPLPLFTVAKTDAG